MTVAAADVEEEASSWQLEVISAGLDSFPQVCEFFRLFTKKHGR